MLGYAVIRIKGSNAVRIINICKAQGIFIYDITRYEDMIIIEVSLNSIEDIQNVCVDIGVTYEVKKKTGIIPFLEIHRYRIIILLSPFIMFMILECLSSHIWRVNIHDNIRYTDEEIMVCLEKEKINIGKEKKKVNTKDIERKIREDFLDITWVSVQKDGSVLNIYVKENEGSEIVSEKDEPVNICASSDGIVKDIITRSGTALVHEGDIVKSGDIVVSGLIELKGDDGSIIEKRYVHADADVSIQYESEYVEKISIKHNVKVYEGSVIQSKSLQIGDIAVSIQKPDIKKSGETIKKWFSKILGKIKIGTKIQNEKKDEKEYFLEKLIVTDKSDFLEKLGITNQSQNIVSRKYRIEVQEYTDEEGIAMINKNISKYFNNLSEKGIQIVEKNVKIYKDSDYIYAKVSLKLLTGDMQEQKLYELTVNDSN